jgi:hypothetical protein
MKTWMLVVALYALMLCPAGAQAPKPLRVAFAGVTTLSTPLTENLKEAGQEVGVSFEVVPFSNEDRNYLIAVTQIGAVANAVIAVDQKSGDVAASVVRSGRITKNGGMKASAKELVQKLAALTK